MICFAAIAPHGDMDLDPTLRPAMEELGRRCAAAAPEVAVVVTPHNVHVDGHYAVITAGTIGEWETDRPTAEALVAAMPDARTEVLDGQEHNVDPAVLGPAMAAFLRD